MQEISCFQVFLLVFWLLNRAWKFYNFKHGIWIRFAPFKLLILYSNPLNLENVLLLLILVKINCRTSRLPARITFSCKQTLETLKFKEKPHSLAALYLDLGKVGYVYCITFSYLLRLQFGRCTTERAVSYQPLELLIKCILFRILPLFVSNEPLIGNNT